MGKQEKPLADNAVVHAALLDSQPPRAEGAELI
jgi:hypothetical protein